MAWHFPSMACCRKQLFQGLCFLWFDKMFSSENKNKFIKSTALRRDTVNDCISKENARVIKELNLKPMMISKKIIIHSLMQKIGVLSTK